MHAHLFNGSSEFPLRSLALLVALSACVAHQRPPLDGAIRGLTRDAASDDRVGFTVVHLRGHNKPPPTATVTATREGKFGFDNLRPGKYDLEAESSTGRAVVMNIDVVPGETSIVDVEFNLNPDAGVHDYSRGAVDDIIEHFTPAHHDASTSVIEGTIANAGSHRRLAGAMVTAIGIGNITLQTVSDDDGRYRFDAVAPGMYTISAYIVIVGQGQMEVRRSDISVGAGQGVRVPIWLDLQR